MTGRRLLVLAAFDSDAAGVAAFLDSVRRIGGDITVGIWSDEFCFLRNRHMPRLSTTERAARVESLGIARTVAIGDRQILDTLAAGSAPPDLVLPQADAPDIDLPAAGRIIRLPAAPGIARAEAGGEGPDDPVKAEFDLWMHSLLIKESTIEIYHAFIALFLSRLEAADIPYFAHSGTSLGMVRNGGFIPWDDDFDIMVMDRHEARVEALIPDLERFGIFRNNSNPNEHFHQFYIRRPDMPETRTRFLPIDIFIGHVESLSGVGEVLHYKSPNFRKWFAKNYIDPDDVYPLRDYGFGPLQVRGLRDYSRYHGRSGYSYVEAVVMRHQNFETQKARLPFFKEHGLHPIRDPRFVRFRVPFGSLGEIPGPLPAA